MIGTHSGLVALVAILAMAGCAAPSVPQGTSAVPGAALPTTLVMVVNTEVGNLAPKAIGATSPGRTTRLFNAALTLADAQENVRPYLAEALPQLNTESWQVFPDGRMETTWKLRPGLTWHDGQPLTAGDFAFALRVYQTTDLAGIFESRPQNWIERIDGLDPQTLRIFWRSPFLFQGEGLEPLPRHLLAEPFAALEREPGAGQRDAFMSAPFWTTRYVGAGPFKLTNWEPASHLEGTAFDGHALGRPKIDRVLLRFINDENTVLANMMGGEVHLIINDVIGFEHAMVLQRQGGFNAGEGKGKVLFTVTAIITAVPQHRPEYQQTPGLLDLRVRKALAHAIDKDAINDGLYEGQASIPHTFVRPGIAYYAEVERAITKYPYDPRATEQLMREAGYAKDREGFFAGASGERFEPALWNSPGPMQDRLLAILLNTWQRAGIDAEPFVVPNALARDQEARHTYPGILVHGIGGSERTSPASLAREQIGTPANRWNGSNRGGWSHPEFELLWERYNTTLVRAEQIQAVVGMMKLQSEQMPNFPLYYLFGITSHVAALKGPEGDSSHWNIHEWELRVMS